MRFLKLIIILLLSAFTAFSQSGKLVGVLTDGIQTSGKIYQVNTDGSSQNVVQAFPISGEGETPVGPLIQGPDGDLYGLMSRRGTGGGTFFKIKLADNSFHVLHSLPRSGTSSVIGKMALASDGYFYGMRGYDFVTGHESIFRIKPDGSDYSIVTQISGGLQSNYGLTFHNGFIYGTTEDGGIHSNGSIFRMDLAGNVEAVLSFQTSVTGNVPYGNLLLASDGMFYGLTAQNSNNRPSIFRVNTNGTGFQTILEITTITFNSNFIGLSENSDGKIIGAAGGRVFQLNKDGSGFVSNNFSNSDHVVIAGNQFFGVTTVNNIFKGTLSPTSTENIARLDDTVGKNVGTMGIANGYLYGITIEGGANNRGTVFRVKLNPAIMPGQVENLKSFLSTDRGQQISERLEVLPNGNIVGITRLGGLSNKGTVFTTKPDGSAYTTIYNPIAADINGTLASVPVFAPDGFLYGVTSTGDVYRVSSVGTDFKRIYTHFNQSATFDTGLFAGHDGWLYGVCNLEPFFRTNGFIYRVRTDGSIYQVLHEFSNVDGSRPSTRLIHHSDGFLYGGTTFGGANNDGVIFKIKPDGSGFAVVFVFQYETTGGLAEDGMFFTSTGSIVGGARSSNAQFGGMIYSVNPNGTNYSILHDFSIDSPTGNIGVIALETPDGNLYGAMEYGGLAGGLQGTAALFKMDPDGQNFTRYDLDLSDDPNATPPTGQLVFIPTKQQQTISFEGSLVKNIDDPPFALTATASSSLPAAYTSSNTSVATITGNQVTIIGEGVTQITARQAGNNQYFAASDLTHTLRVGKIQPNVTIKAPSTGTAGDLIAFTDDFHGPLNLLEYSVHSGTGSAELAPGNKLKLLQAGTVTLSLKIAGNADYHGSTIDHEIIIKKKKIREFSISIPTSGKVGNTLTITTLHESSQGTITYSLEPVSGSAIIMSNKLSLQGEGVVRLNAHIEADASYEAADASILIDIYSASPQADQIYGAMSGGGSGNAGVLYSMNPDGTGYRVLKHFSPFQPTVGSVALMVPDGNGTFFGSHSSSLFKFDMSTQDYQIITGFAVTSATLTAGSDGNIYGVTENSSADITLRIIKIVDGSPTTITSNNSLRVSESFFRSSLTEHSNGKFYGPANFVNGNVGIFEFNPSTGVITPKIELAATAMARIDNTSRFVAASNGLLYAITSAQSGRGGIIEYDPVGNTLVRKVATNVDAPFGFIAGENGKLLAINRVSVTNQIIEYTPGATNFVVKAITDEFNSVTVLQPMVKAEANKYYLVARDQNQDEKLFLYDATLNTLRSKYIGTNTVYGPLVSVAGKFLQLWGNRGNYGDGGIVEIDPATSTVTELYSFMRPFVQNSPDGFDARIGTNLYGILGIANVSIYKFDTKTGVTSIVYTPEPGANMFKGSLIDHPNGKLYGIQIKGNVSSIVEFNPNTGQSIISVLDGVIPNTSSISGSNYFLASTLDGKIFGVSGNRSADGTSRKPVLFEFDLATRLPIIISELPSMPTGRFVEGPDHRLYGYCGNFIMRFDPASRNVDVVYEFTTPSGAPPIQVPFFSSDGKMYGTSTAGAANGRGALFEFDITTSQLANRFHFTDNHTSQRSIPMVDGLNNTLIGTVGSRGAGDLGYIYTLDKATGALVFTNCVASTGSTPRGGLQRLSVVVKSSQTISFDEITAQKTIDEPFELKASSSSGLPVQYNIANTSVATVENNVVTIVGAGTTTITATQAGNDQYEPAEPVTRQLVVTKANQQITFPLIVDKVAGSPSFQMTATSSSGLPIIYSTPSDKVTIAGAQVSLLKPGRLTIKAEQPGDANYNPAEAVTQSFCIKPAKPIITVNGDQLTSSNADGNKWYLNGSVIIGAVSKTLTVSTGGDYTVQTTVDECASEVSAVVNVAITGIDEDSTLALSISPNPAKNEITVNVTSIECGLYNIIIRDALGRTRYTGSKEFNTYEQIDVSEFVDGLYFLTIEHKEARFVRKLIVSK